MAAPRFSSDFDWARATHDVCPDAVMWLDDAGAVLYANAVAESIWSRSPGSLVGENLESLVDSGLDATAWWRPAAGQTVLRAVRPRFGPERGMPLDLRLIAGRLAGQAATCLLGRLLGRSIHLPAAQPAVTAVAEPEDGSPVVEFAPDLLRAVVDAIGDGIAVADGQGRMLYLNDTAQRITGLRSIDVRPEDWPELAGVYLADGVTPCPFDQVPLYRALRGESLDQVEICLRPAHLAEPRWISVTARPLRDSRGAIDGGVCLFRDISLQRQAEAALRESEERFRELAEHVGEVFWIVSADFQQIYYLSPAFESVFGRNRQDVLRAPATLIEAIHPDDRERVASERLPAEARHAELLYRIERPDGEVRWLRSRRFPIFDAQGQVRRFAGIVEDVTDHRVAEFTQAQNAQRQTAVAELGRRAVIDSESASLFDLAARLLFENLAADYCGVAELSPDRGKLVLRAVCRAPSAPGDRLRANQAEVLVSQSLAQVAFDTGSPVVMGDARTETRFDSTVLQRLGVVSALVAPIRLHDRTYGTLGALCLTPREFTSEDVRFVEAFAHILAGAIDRQRNLERIGSSESRLRSLLENLPDSVILLDASGTVRFVNATAPGLTPDEVVGSNAFNYVPAEFHERLRAALDNVFTSERKDSFEHVALNDRWWSSRFVPIRDGLERLALVISRDITARRLADAEVRRNQALLRQSLLAHERERQLVAYEIHDGLVQDVTGAVMHLDAVTGHASPERMQQALRMVIDLLRRTIDDGRRLISGLRPPIIDEMGIAAAIEYLIREQRQPPVCPVVFEHRLVLERFDPLLEGTVYRIAQEGLSNLHRHSQAQHAAVRLVEEGTQLVLEIQDDGVGFDPTRVAQRRFGLQGIRERTKLLHGRVEIDSAPGRGTRLRVELPLARGAAEEG